MKKVLQLLVVVLLLLSFVGCASDADDRQYEPMAESVDDEYSYEVEQGSVVEDVEEKEPEVENEIRAVVDPMANFTSTWAKTDTHFFFSYTRFSRDYGDDGNAVYHIHYALYRLPLNDITRGERVAVPGDGEFEILGMSEQYLFVSRRSSDWDSRSYDTYRISLSTLEAVFIDSGIYYGIPFFHLASNSILFAHGGFDEGAVRLEYLRLDTDQRNIFYEFDSENFLSFNTGWWQMENDAVVFINSNWAGVDGSADFILIDSELQARQIRSYEIERGITLPSEPQNPAEEFIFELGAHSFGGYATIGDWVYYLWIEDRGHGRSRNLYRINIDGTQNTLLQEETGINWLWGVNNTLLAVVPTDQPAEGPASWYEAVVLAEDGSVAKVLGGGWYGHNATFGIQQLMDTDMVMIMQFNFFIVYGSVLGLYCTTTGALFSLSAP